MAWLGLHGANGIVGFIPKDAVNSATNVIALEVVVEFDDKSSRSVAMATTLRELEDHVRKGATEGLRQLFRDRAREVVMSATPPPAATIAKVADIFWVCQSPPRREPFLRY
jgi:hypothetical protein